MKIFAFLIFIICFFTTFATAQKTVRKRTKTPSVQTKENQSSSETNRDTNENYSSQSNQNQKKPDRFDTPVRILDKPRPQFLDGQDCSQGTVILRVKFLSSGEIGEIAVIKGLTKGKTDSSIEAAKKIKFEPAMKNGKPVSVAKLVEYGFTIY